MVQDVIDPVTIESSAGPVSQLIDKLGGDLAEAILRFGSGHRQVISGATSWPGGAVTPAGSTRPSVFTPKTWLFNKGFTARSTRQRCGPVHAYYAAGRLRWYPKTRQVAKRESSS